MGTVQSHQEAQTPEGSFLAAASRGSLSSVERALTQDGVHVDAADENGWTALMLAASSGHGKVVAYLLEQNAQVNAVNQYQSTALLLAAISGHVPVTRMLLDWNAEIEAAKPKQGTALMIAAAQGHADVTRLLLDRNANIEAAEPKLGTALMIAAANGHVDVTRLLLDCKANIEAAEPKLGTPLMIAAAQGHTDVTRLLLDRNANIEAAEPKFGTALMIAAARNQVAVSRLLLDRGARIEAAEPTVGTSLMIAAAHGHVDVSRLLLDRNANIEAAEPKLGTPLMIAAANGHVDVSRLLLDRGANSEAAEPKCGTALMIAAANGHVDVSRLLLDRNANIEAAERDHGTALMIAAANGHVAVSRLLLDRDANIEAAEPNQGSALMIAAAKGHVDVLRLLLDRNANVNHVNDQGCTSISIAAASGHLQALRLLLAKDVDVNSIDELGNTPLVHAAMNGRASVVAFLLEHGANIGARNHEGKTALEYATELDRRDLMQMLQPAAGQRQKSPLPGTTTSVASLDQVELLCSTMLEAQAMCLHIHSRLVCLSTQLVSGSDRTLQTKYQVILTRFQCFLAQYKDKRVIARIVSSRAVISQCRQLHQEMDALATEWDPDSQMTWADQFLGDSQPLRGLLTAVLQPEHVLHEELQDTQAQTEALTLLLFEVNERSENYSPEEMALIRQLFQSVARYSTLGIPSLPKWFLPPHELVLGGHIGGGGYGSVHRGSWLGTLVAVKFVLLHEPVETGRMFRNEAEIWSSLQHPHVVKLYGACHVGNPFFVCEYAAKGSLPSYLYDTKHRHKTWQCLYQAALGLCYLHAKRRIVHRDVKCDNIVVTQDGAAKLTDFGLSCYQADLPAAGDASNIGAVQWKAPECISGESSGSFASDVYSFGMAMIEAVVLGFPWGMMEDVAVKHKVSVQHELPLRPESMSYAQWGLIQRMCATDPANRPDMNAVVQELKEFADQEKFDHEDMNWKRHQQLKLTD